MSIISNNIVDEKHKGKDWPSFSNSMKYSYHFNNLKTDLDKWSIIEDRYAEIKSREIQENRIPKIVHQIWLGGNMPDSERKMVKQVKENLGKDWEYILWTEENISNLKNFKNIEMFNQTPNFGQKSDILRYNILSEIGGVYLDTDFIILKQFDELLDLDFFCGVSYDDNPTLCNGLIGCSPNNNLINSLLEFDKPLVHNDIMKIIDSTGPYFVTRKVFKHITEDKNICILPTSFFYPLPNFDISKSKGTDYRNYLEKESICCHMWSSSWM